MFGVVWKVVEDWNGKAGSQSCYTVFLEDPPSPGRLRYPELLVQFNTEKGTSNSNSSCLKK